MKAIGRSFIILDRGVEEVDYFYEFHAMGFIWIVHETLDENLRNKLFSAWSITEKSTGLRLGLLRRQGKKEVTECFLSMFVGRAPDTVQGIIHNAQRRGDLPIRIAALKANTQPQL